MKSTITSPKSFFGYQLGADREMARWDEIVRYFDLLGSESDRVRTIHMGPSTEGNPFLEVIITSPENFENLEEIRRISMTLADPRGLSQEEIDSLVQKGKAVCVQSMSLHATEIGGTQMAPLLAYDMAVADDPDTLRILNEVVFIMIPCFNPDGEIMVTDFYKSTIGTPYEGCHYPILYHKYTGHDNNRDAFAQNIVESRYMGQILFHEWMPQAYQDHHHMGSNGARIFIAPYKNPLRPGVDPLVWRELNLYGAGMAYHMESEGLDGVTSGAQYPSWGHFGYHWITNSHNIPVCSPSPPAPNSPRRSTSTPRPSRATATTSCPNTRRRPTSPARGKAVGGTCPTLWTASMPRPTACSTLWLKTAKPFWPTWRAKR